MDEQEVKPRSWLRVEFAGIAALAMIFGCLFIGETAEQLAENIVPVVEDSKLKPQFNAIDYSSTGSTKSATIVIGPCDIKRP